MTDGARIEPLFRHPRHVPLVAGWIHHEFWEGKAGYTREDLERLLRDASDPDHVPLSLLALAGDRPAGTVNLIHNDDPARPHLHPWLAALVVVPELRRHGIGSALVRALAADAARLGFFELFLGTDIPAYYARLGATVHEQVAGTFCIMRLPLRGGA